MKQHIRVRFAPSPTGFMHLGNIRAALMNFLFAKKNNGTLILRIEDTDKKRNTQESLQAIIQDLNWLGLSFDEGPGKNEHQEPFLQSQRTHIYQEALKELIKHQKAYRCFCTQEQLNAKRQQQMQQGKPPRYDKTCLHLSQDKIKQKVTFGLPFIWRLNINNLQTFTIQDLAKGNITFDMKNFADFALTRQDESVTFTFANFVDDWKMNISHVIRGQDHLTNTAYQAALYDAFAVKTPTFWHLPIICNNKGEKMSKRDFGFSLQDLQQAGYLPEAILNYLATLGISLKKEVLSLVELQNAYPFNAIPSGGNISHNAEKLTWFNKQWISQFPVEKLAQCTIPKLVEHFPEIANWRQQEQVSLIAILQKELKTLNDIAPLIQFVFTEPETTSQQIFTDIDPSTKEIIISLLSKIDVENQSVTDAVTHLKKQAKEKELPFKPLFQCIRMILTGSKTGLGILEIMQLLKPETIMKRINKIIGQASS